MDEWKNSSTNQAWCMLLAGCGRFSDFRIEAEFGTMEAGHFDSNISQALFAKVVQRLGQGQMMNLWSDASPCWEHIIENFYVFEDKRNEIREWNNRHLNLVRRYKRKELKFLRLALGCSPYWMEVKSAAISVIDLAQPMNAPKEKLIALRQRRTFILSDCVSIHCDLVSEKLNTTTANPTLSPTVHARRIALEVAHFNAKNLTLMHLHMGRFMTQLKQFIFDLEVIVTPSCSPSSSAMTECIQECLPLIHQFRNEAEVELEGRLGELKAVLHPKPHYQFISGVSRDRFFALITKLEEYKNWSNLDHDQWKDSIDIFFGNLRGTKTRETTMSQPMTYLVKNSIAAVNFRCPERQYGIRVSLKRETKVNGRQNLSTRATLYRIKRRRSFVLGNAWRFDFSIVAEGETDEDAILKPKKYEVEVEVLRHTHTLFDKKPDELALSLLEKLLQLLDNDESPITLQVALDELATYDA